MNNVISKSNITHQKIESPQIDANNVLISDGGYMTFVDGIEGTVTQKNGATGYQYIQGIPSSFNNGVCYDIGQISNTTDLSNVKFTGRGELVQTCELWFTTPATPPTTHKWPYGAELYWIDSATGAAPTLWLLKIIVLFSDRNLIKSLLLLLTFIKHYDRKYLKNSSMWSSSSL